MILSDGDARIAWLLQYKWDHSQYFSDHDCDELHRLMLLEGAVFADMLNHSQQIQVLKSWLLEAASERLGWNLEWANSKA